MNGLGSVVRQPIDDQHSPFAADLRAVATSERKLRFAESGDRSSMKIGADTVKPAPGLPKTVQAIASEAKRVLQLRGQSRILLTEVVEASQFLYPTLAEDEEHIIAGLQRPAHPALQTKIPRPVVKLN